MKRALGEKHILFQKVCILDSLFRSLIGLNNYDNLYSVAQRIVDLVTEAGFDKRNVRVFRNRIASSLFDQGRCEEAR